ncbi:MurR/RpiR family transcriptional regulator [Haloplasma contractile]|uniref:Asparaginyl-tRNA synthetase protein n=1 Tax=Haloplasma contractile SSD-17B TaxID=1033810 RepID=U2DZM8_9MOLU|nr:MurR/RpiR family transcriptional regulator [Haloplasma contractile]ERJ13657.1 asparaginyl-tRNA synthetase protein [Haloplasma contractile SSD-17B]
MVDSIESRINAVSDKFTKSDRKLIEYFREHTFQDVIYQSITELSELCGVGEATILRFCRKLGLKGYQEFKLVLAQELAKSSSSENEGFVGQIADNMTRAIEETKNIIDLDELDKAVDIIVNSNRKYFFGLGNSGIVARECKYRLLRIGLHVDAIVESHFQAMSASTLSSEDVVVLISVSGSTKDIIKVAKIAKENNVKVIVITNYSKSPVTKYADLVLYSVRKEGPLEGGSLISKISQLYVVDVLCTGISLAIDGAADIAREKTARAVVDKIV